MSVCRIKIKDRNFEANSLYELQCENSGLSRMVRVRTIKELCQSPCYGVSLGPPQQINGCEKHDVYTQWKIIQP
jgi:hypothetical protein